ncbi:MAG: GldG family protein [Oscillospiraceae bacterium]|jgi:ABC-2 type transport system permease protein|nr:GldG family protein [Oscillospiraceae bacterium]MDD3261226.1 Gldg family protein [Oscillospiraceae bacterium]
MKDKKTDLQKSEYVKDKEKQAAEDAAQKRRKQEKEAKKERKESRPPLRQRMRSQRFRHGAAARAVTALGLVVLVLVNVLVSSLSDRYPSMNIDLSAGSLNSLSDSVKKVVDNVKQDTQLIIMGTEEQVKNNEILSSYSVKYSQVGVLAGKMAERNRKISVVYKDLDKDPTFATQYSSDSLTTGDVVVKTAKRSYVVKSTDLFDVQSDSTTGSQSVYTQVGDALAAGLNNANSDNLPVIAFETGHQEQLDASAMKKLCTSNNFQTKDVNLLTDKIPANAQMVFIGAPKTDYTDSEIKKLDAFLSSTSSTADRGILLSAHVIDPAKFPKLSAFLKEWGINLQNSVAMESDASKYVMEQPAYILADAQTDITLNKSTTSYSNLLMPIAQTMTLSEVTGVTTSALMKSGSTSYNVGTTGSDTSSSGKTKQASVVAAIGQKSLTSGSKKMTASVAVCGSAVFFTDGIVNANTYANGTWSADLARYITGTGGTGSVTVTPIQTNASDIKLSSAAAMVLGFGVFTVIIPLCLFIAGIVVYRKRRKL